MSSHCTVCETTGKTLAVKNLKTIELHAYTSLRTFRCDADDVARAPQRGEVWIHPVRHIQHYIKDRADGDGVLGFKEYSHF